MLRRLLAVGITCVPAASLLFYFYRASSITRATVAGDGEIMTVGAAYVSASWVVVGNGVAGRGAERPSDDGDR